MQVFYALCVGSHENSQIVKDGAIGSSMHGIKGNPKLKCAIPSAPSSPKFEGVSTIGTANNPIDQDMSLGDTPSNPPLQGVRPNETSNLPTSDAFGKSNTTIHSLRRLVRKTWMLLLMRLRSKSLPLI